MKARILAFAALAVLVWSGQSPAQDNQAKAITIATEGAFPPWNAVDTAGQPIGFDIDVGKALCERAKLTCTFVTQAWDGIIPALKVGKFDAIMAGMSITDKRKEVIAFSEPYALTSNYFVVAKTAALPSLAGDARLDLSSSSDNDKTLLQTLKHNLQGKVIGVQGSTNAEAFVRQYLGDAVDVRSYDTQDNLNLDLSAGRIDAGLADYSVWQEFLQSNEGAAAEIYGPRISGGIFGPGVGIGMRKEDSALVDRLNAAIDAARADGTLRQISIQWFHADLVSE
ncbi:lysine/arginine/ornithine ABC transporter substrate-binding protein [Neorhizobium sp. NCHU2750]|uniref:lysine/arginine/ornithine ABC transporter substrate-binding protein n=1 Tax=Neorhizobium sp. NCHU2750 TaxID=1825976 RepID=UPI000E70F728|nr:octopine/nopaline ABC transporter substrate-binding protein [Neorhizobium sp. NCHU2750]